MTTEEHELVPPGSDDHVISGGMHRANADFKVFVLFVGEIQASGGVCLTVKNTTNETTWIVSELHGLKFGLASEERRKVGGAPVIDHGNAF